MSTTVLLIRHATTPMVGQGLSGWLPGISLDDAGREQAEGLVSRLRTNKIDAIYASPLERTQETAAPLAADRGLVVTVRPEFAEINFGDWQGKKFSEIERHSLWTPFNEYRSTIRPPAGEMMLETQARMVAGLMTCLELHPDETIAIFTHGDAIKSVICHVLGVPLDFHLRLEIAPVSVTTVEFCKTLAVVRSLNVANNA